MLLLLVEAPLAVARAVVLVVEELPVALVVGFSGGLSPILWMRPLVLGVSIPEVVPLRSASAVVKMIVIGRVVSVVVTRIIPRAVPWLLQPLLSDWVVVILVM